jgi:N utilization substance protein B
MTKRRIAREMALSTIYRMEVTGDWTFSDTNIDKQAKNDKYVSDYAIKIIRKVIELKSQIDTLIAKFSHNWSFDRISVVDKSVLRIAIAEFFMTTPKTVVINEALEIVDTYSEKNSKPFINALLDTISLNLNA